MNSNLRSRMPRHHVLLIIPIVNSEILLQSPKWWLALRAELDKHRPEIVESAILLRLPDAYAPLSSPFEDKGRHHLPVKSLEWVAVGQSKGAFSPALLWSDRSRTVS